MLILVILPYLHGLVLVVPQVAEEPKSSTYTALIGPSVQNAKQSQPKPQKSLYRGAAAAMPAWSKWSA